MAALTRFSQMDPRWKDAQLGADPELTIGSHGCLLTDLAMVATGFGFDVTPLSLNEQLMSLGPAVGFQGGLVVPSSLPRALPGMIFRRYFSARAVPAPISDITATLAAHLPVIVEVDYAPLAGLQNHWLVLTGVQDGDFHFEDPLPYPPENQAAALMRSRYAFGGSLAQIITAALWLEGPQPVSGKPEGAISLYAAADQLALRAQPFIDPANLIKRLALNTALYSLEPAAQTLQKVGVVNQWMHVQDRDGARGYAAAWYLSAQQSVLTPIPPGNTALRVYASADGLALRASPVVGPDNLLARLAFGSELHLLEETSAAQEKIGKLNQWLWVKDPSARQGFVAAWYVTAQPPVALGVSAPPAGVPPSHLTVRTALPGLALRSQPRIAPETLLQRLEGGAPLSVVEPVETALPKIGAPGAWLEVRTSTGQMGYVAAWYVSRE